MKDYETQAAALYDGGWRKEDMADLMAEYDMTQDEAEAVCVILERFESEDKE